VVIVVIVVGLRSWSTNEYAITPGNATNVAPLVTVKGLATDTTADRIMLVDVYLQPLSELQYLWMHFDAHVQFVTAGQLLEPGIPNSELTNQGFLEMSDSQEYAEVAALRALGWSIPAVPTGAVITAVAEGTPAARAGLQVGDEITAVDGVRVTSACSLIGSLDKVAAGTKVRVTLRHGSFSAAGVLHRSAPTTIMVTTSASPHPNAATGCAQFPKSGPSYVGVVPEDGVTYTLPGVISVDTANIGGPSAGLAMTLTIIDQLSRGSLTGHHVIAATGTIDPSGAVGDVGGVAEKTIAVENAGAQYFFVPQVEVATARSVANSRLHIIGVTSLSQVLSDLRKLGGAAPVPLTAPH
jgi:PDZ domain-containing protein